MNNINNVVILPFLILYLLVAILGAKWILKILFLSIKLEEK